MARLQIQGTVVHMAGSWGAAVPVANAQVVIVDRDAPGRGDDAVLTVTTSSAGMFSGTSADWQDQITTKIWVPRRWVPGAHGGHWQAAHWETNSASDPTDVLVLSARVSADGQSAELPFVFVDDHTPSPPLVVPWAPPGSPAPMPFTPVIAVGPVMTLAAMATVDGVGCLTVADVNQRLRAAIAAGGARVCVGVHGPDASSVPPFSAPSGLLDWARGELRIPGALWPVSPSPDPADALAVGCALVRSGVATSPLRVCVGLGVLYAMHHGYRTITAAHRAGGPGTLGPGVEFTVER